MSKQLATLRVKYIHEKYKPNYTLTELLGPITKRGDDVNFGGYLQGLYDK